jgi:hypothetical protein
MKKFFSFTLIIVLLFISEALAGINISEPQDKAVTFEEVLMLDGRGKNLEILKINDQKLKFKRDGSFACGLVLKRGKNLIEVRALDRGKEHHINKIRILRLKTYPDIEYLYDGKKHWARNQIIYLASFGMIEGYPDDLFYPANPITRGELATWLARVKNLEIPQLTEDVFFDVPKEHWRAPYVKAAVKAGFMRGFSKETFGIDDPISRRQVAEVAVLTEGYEVVERIKPLFVDVPREEKWAYPIYVAKEKGLVLGISGDIPVFDPDRALTRAEAAVLISRFKRSLASIRYLFDFNKGYGMSDYCKVNVAPDIVSFRVEPDNLRTRQKSNLQLRVGVATREGFYPISKVKVDLSEIGGMPDAEMFDDGSHGDEQKEDLVYSLNVTLEPSESGSKMLTTTVIDRLGWESQKSTSLLVVE